MEKLHIPEFKGKVISRFFGKHPDGDVTVTILKNKNGTEAAVLSYGAVLQGLKIIAANGKEIDVVLGFDNLENYIASYALPAAPYFGAIIGRHAGRIKNALFSVSGNTYQLEANNNAHSLHGGNLGFSRKLWTVTSVSDGENPSVSLNCESPHLEDGFPGHLSTQVTYTLTANDELCIDMTAVSTEDTVVNLTHHSYFNMDGHKGSIGTQTLFVNASQIAETDAELIPTGSFNDLQGSPFDFRDPKICPKTIDTTFAVSKGSKPAAWLQSDESGLKLSVYTDQPAVHIYAGGNLFGQLKGKDNTAYHPLSGICFETQFFPDAPNQPSFPTTVLSKGETYTHRTIYQLQNISQ